MHSFLKFQNKIKLNTHIYTFNFERDRKSTFRAGQYIKLKQKIFNETFEHFFTISSSPTNLHTLSITTKIRKFSSFKQSLLDLKPGALLEFEPPSGDFILNPRLENQVFISGGMGITPFHSMLQYAHSKKLRNKFILISSFSKLEDVLFYDELKDIEDKNQNIKIIYTLTEDRSSNFKMGRITKNLIRENLPAISNIHFMIVGPPQMVIDMENEVDLLNLKSSTVQIENFTGY